MKPLFRYVQERLAALATLLLFASGPFSQAEPNPKSHETSTYQWRYTLEQPGAGWQQVEFNDRQWQLGEGGFGTRATPGARVGTKWTTKNIWLRRALALNSMPDKPALLLHHDEDVEVYINGESVASLEGWQSEYQIVLLDAAGARTLHAGENVLAVHCQQTSGGQFVDVHVIDADNPPSLPAEKPFQSELITKWGAEVRAENAWTEYPRPQLTRSQWQNLNGNWDYAVTPIERMKPPQAWDGEILVPFCLESKLGGVQKKLEQNETLWYHRSFNVAQAAGQRTLLNFEAVDYRCEVLVNGNLVGEHQGGNTPFAFDVTDALRDGDNELVVRVEDETEGWQLHGKQVRNPGGIFYTSVSGIWQTVWLEQVPVNHVVDLTIHTDAETGVIEIMPEIEGQQAVATVRVVVKEGNAQVVEVTGVAGSPISLTIPNAKLWSPDSPHLYDLEVALLDANGNLLDTVASYAGIRTVGKLQDADGDWRMTLNDKILFHWGTLDQGWWPDGLLTPPSDEAMLFDVEYLQSAGFNMIRKHIKIEPRRYYYHCDRLGMMMWQDQVSGGKNPPWTRLDPDPQDENWPKARHEQYMAELERMIDTLESHPCIVVWVPFNEAWGQHRTVEVGNWVGDRDPTRLVNIASGGNFWPVGDIVDHHAYPNPDFPFDGQRYGDFIKVVGEFGGHGYPAEGHLWDANQNNWGYGGLPKTMEEYKQRYITSLDMLDDLRKQGVAGGVYTQTTDVEGEINGLMSYDRKLIKLPATELRELHRRLFEER